jgi:hypothetical protein
MPYAGVPFKRSVPFPPPNPPKSADLKHTGAFSHEALGGGQANPAASACDNRNFPRQFLSVVVAHMFSPFIYSC